MEEKREVSVAGARMYPEDKERLKRLHRLLRQPYTVILGDALRLYEQKLMSPTGEDQRNIERGERTVNLSEVLRRVESIRHQLADLEVAATGGRVPGAGRDSEGRDR